MPINFTCFTFNPRYLSKYLLITTFLSFMFVQLVQAQNVEGIVQDANNLPLVGATVVIQGTQTGSITNEEGYFSLQVADEQDSLVISYIGYTTKVVKADPENEMRITLQEGVTSLGDVVITALGIEREKKALGFAVQEVQGDVLT